MREIKSHLTDPKNPRGVKLLVLDEPGSGGANHQYKIEVTSEGKPSWLVDIPFQNGGIQEVGTNGLTNEVLLAIVKDRLEGFQSGQFKTRENAIALTHIDDAMHWLHHRTRERESRGVEGKSVK